MDGALFFLNDKKLCRRDDTFDLETRSSRRRDSISQPTSPVVHPAETNNLKED